MKRAILTFIITFLVNVNAATISLDGPPQVNKNEEFELSININDVNNLGAIDFDYEYPTDKLILSDDYTKNNDWTVTFGNRVAVAIGSNGFTGNSNIIKMKFKVKDNFNSSEALNIKIKNITASDIDLELIEISDVTFTIQVKNNSGSNNSTTGGNSGSDAEDDKKNPETGSNLRSSIIIILFILSVIYLKLTNQRIFNN